MEANAANQLKLAINNEIDSLIEKIEPLTMKKQGDINISQLLEDFYKTVLKSENYLQSGIFTINFAKASTFLDHAFKIYAKQVDLLFDMSINSQKRYLSYEEQTEEVVEAQKQLDEKAQKGKRGRKKKVVEEKSKVDIDWLKIRVKMQKLFRKAAATPEKYDFENELDVVDVNQNIVDTCDGLKFPKERYKLYQKTYSFIPYMDGGYGQDIDEDGYFTTNNFTNLMDFEFPEYQRKHYYNRTHNDKKIDTIGCDFTDKAFQHFISNEGINPEEVTGERYEQFKRYLKRYSIEGKPPMSLTEKCKKLCPRRTSIVLTRLSDEVVQQHLKNEQVRLSLSQDESGFFDESVENTFEGENEEGSSLNPEGNVTTVEIIKQKQDVERRERIKRKKVKVDEDDDQPRSKRRRKKELLKWLKTTTVALKRFERFFCRNYLSEEGEGEVLEPDFSSDEEDLDENNAESDLNHLENDVINPEVGLNNQEINQNNPENNLNNSENNQNEENNENNLSGQNDSGFFSTEEFDEVTEIEVPLTEIDIFEKEERIKMRERYYQWNAYIRDELKKYGQNDFDIHEYGTKIIDNLSEEQPTQFIDIIRNNTNINNSNDENSNISRDIARYFAAALQLANTENIKLQNFKQGELANNLEVILINKDRPHEHLDGYKVASNEIIKEKLKKMGNVDVSEDKNNQNDRNYERNSKESGRKYKKIKLGG